MSSKRLLHTRSIRAHLLALAFSVLILPHAADAKGGGRSGGVRGSGRGGTRTGGGGILRPGGSRWVFWYYPMDGSGRKCGNVCVLVFTILAIVIITILMCVVVYCVQRYRSRRKIRVVESGEGHEVRNGDARIGMPKTEKVVQVSPPRYEEAVATDAPQTVSAPREELGQLQPLSDVGIPRPSVPADRPLAAKEFLEIHPLREEISLEEHELALSRDGFQAWRLSADPSLEHARVLTTANDGHTVTFAWQGMDLSVQSNLPLFAPRDRLPGSKVHYFLYFEATVVCNPNPETTIAVGLATRPYPWFRLPGWHKHSIAYHSDDGRKYADSTEGEVFGPRWGEVGDTIGCGYFPVLGQVFFTKNGEFVGNAITHADHVWYPTIGADGACHLYVNWGDDGEFRYKEARALSPGALKD